MAKANTKRETSTFAREMRSPSFRAALKREEALLEVSEFIAQAMAEQELSVRELASRASVSPTIIQGLRRGKRKNIEYSTLKSILGALGFEIAFKKARQATAP